MPSKRYLNSNKLYMILNAVLELRAFFWLVQKKCFYAVAINSSHTVVSRKNDHVSGRHSNGYLITREIIVFALKNIESF